MERNSMGFYDNERIMKEVKVVDNLRRKTMSNYYFVLNENFYCAYVGMYVLLLLKF